MYASMLTGKWWMLVVRIVERRKSIEEKEDLIETVDASIAVLREYESGIRNEVLILTC